MQLCEINEQAQLIELEASEPEGRAYHSYNITVGVYIYISFALSRATSVYISELVFLFAFLFLAHFLFLTKNLDFAVLCNLPVFIRADNMPV